MGSMDHQQLWLRFSLEPGLSPALRRDLLTLAGSAAAVYGMPYERLQRVVGPELAVSMLSEPDEPLARSLEAALRWTQQQGHALLTWDDARYPAALRELYDAPPLLYLWGRVEYLAAPSVAVVGARNATRGGLENATRFAHALANLGWCVVSGLATGVDAAADEGALLAGQTGAGTVAVMGTGMDILYPRRNQALAQRIAETGVVISEAPLGTPPTRHQFPRRNRLVAGLVRGVLVVEAAPRSGSLITARLGAELGREVFAIPGSIHSPLSRGCHALIRQGAKLAESVDDILAELQGALPLTSPADARPLPPADPAGREVLAALGFDPLSVDELAARTDLPTAELLRALLNLELAGRVARLDGGRFQQLRGGASEAMGWG